MTDHKKDTGATGTMMIRDSGGYVEFWLQAGSQTFNHDLPWAYVVNGNSSSWRSFDFHSGGDWQKLYRVKVSTSQTVTFKLGDTGTSGLGGPTTFSVKIDRTSKPSAPSSVKLTNATSSSVLATFTDGASNGDAIDSRQIGYGTSSTTPQKTVSSDKSTTITGLTPGATYYFWARTHNSEGWSSWSAKSSLTLGAVVRVKITGRWKPAVCYYKDNGIWKVVVPWIKTGGVWKEAK
jgi:hypothetical protein